MKKNWAAISKCNNYHLKVALINTHRVEEEQFQRGFPEYFIKDAEGQTEISIAGLLNIIAHAQGFDFMDEILKELGFEYKRFSFSGLKSTFACRDGIPSAVGNFQKDGMKCDIFIQSNKIQGEWVVYEGKPHAVGGNWYNTSENNSSPDYHEFLIIRQKQDS